MAFIIKRPFYSLGSPLNAAPVFIIPVVTTSFNITFPFNEPSLMAYLQTHGRGNIWEENPNTAPPVTLATGTVGQVDDPTIYSSFIWATVQGDQRPRFPTSGSFTSSLFFEGTQNIKASNSSASFNFVHAVFTGTILLNAQRTTNNSETMFANQTNNQATQRGFSLETIGGGALRFRVMNGAATFRYNHTTSNGLFNVETRMPIAIRLGHAVSGSQIRVGATGSWDTMTLINGSASNGFPTTDFMVGDRANADNGFNGYIGHLMFFTSALDDSIIDTYMTSYNPDITTASVLVQDMHQDSGSNNFLYGWYDFSDSSTYDTGAGDQGIIRHKLDTTSSLLIRHGVGNAIAYTASLSGAVFNKNDGFRFQRSLPMSGAAQTYFAVLRNDDQTSGSTIIQGGSMFWAQYGSSSLSGAVHMIFISGSSLSCSVPSPAAYNVLEIQRNGGTFMMRTNNGAYVTASNMTGAFTPYFIGTNPVGVSNLGMSGIISEIRVYNAALGQGRADTIMTALRNKYSIS